MKINITSVIPAISLIILIAVMTGCMKEKGLYDPDLNKKALSPEIQTFGFSMRGDVKLSVNYNAPGFKTLIKVYDQNPLDESYNLKEGIEPIYSAYTDNNGKFEGMMNIPTSVKEAYLYTFLIGLPRCVKLQATTNGFAYNAAQQTQTKAMQTRANSCPYVNTASFPYQVYSNGGTRSDNAYSLVTWDVNGVPAGEQFIHIEKIGDEQIGTISKRVTNFLVANNGGKGEVGNQKLLREPHQINIKAPAEGMEVSVTYVGAKGEYHNSFGYYYYKTNSSVSASDFYGMKKYIIFPHAHPQALQTGNTVKLLYFDENGKADTKFPAGYTIGWFLISDGFSPFNNSYIKKIDELGIRIPERRNTCTSNDLGDYRQFITIYDQKSKTYVVGIEDQLAKKDHDDYMDLTFFVTTTPDLGQGDIEEVPGTDPDDSATTSRTGTLAFEDTWPFGDDYDMNDVAVEYKRDVTFNGDNKITAVKEYFKFVQKANAAVFNNFFAYQVENMGTLKTLPENCKLETATNSIIFTQSSKNSIGKEFTVERSWNGSIDKDEIIKDFNPYIIIQEISEQRKEVHLPNYKPTSYADSGLLYTQDEAYYMNINGYYAFAIDVPVINFTLSPERTAIDQTYPRYKSWADSQGTKDQDWYK